MAYPVIISKIFPHPIEKVFDTFCDLDRYPLWNSDSSNFSKSGKLKENMLYEYDVKVGDKISHSQIEVVRLVENDTIELINNSALFRYHAVYRFLSEEPGETELVCMLHLELPRVALRHGRPALEAVTEQRIAAAFEALGNLLSS